MSVDKISPPLNPYESYPLPWKPEFKTDLAQNLVSLSLTKMMLQIKFDCSWPAGCGDIYTDVKKKRFIENIA